MSERFSTLKYLGLFNALGGECGGFGLFVDDIVAVIFLVDVLLGVHLFDFGHAKGAGEFVGTLVKVGGFLPLSRNDERGSGLVDKYRVNLVDDGEIVASLNLVLKLNHHVVAEIVKAHLVVGAVGYVGGIGGSALVVTAARGR